MSYETEIGSICSQICRACGTIAGLTEGIGTSGLGETYKDLRMDELEHAQILILRLTELITADSPEFAGEEPAEDGDSGSVFAAGDLTDEMGRKDEEKKTAAEPDAEAEAEEKKPEEKAAAEPDTEADAAAAEEEEKPEAEDPKAEEEQSEPAGTPTPDTETEAGEENGKEEEK